MNHEIYGVPTGTDYGFKFITNLHAWRNGAEAVYTPPVHPTQLYEAAAYLLIFILCMWLYFQKDAWRKPGYIFGTFLATLFSARFIIEFFKEIQEPFEKDMTLNMGQLLSLPFIVAGVYFVARANKKGTGLRKRRNKESQPQVK
jgi:prolipoprotein diacylglyceryltransferase